MNSKKNKLIKEFNSSMAMGALKQINNDAKELESMLQPSTELEDWVKSKLNLAGEYLDDVYHHLDHFGPQGRKLDEGLNELDYEGGVGIHELMNFYSKANPEQVRDMDFCLRKKNISCVKELVKKVTGMTMVNINESCFDNLQLYRDIAVAKRLEEGWKDWVAAGAIGLGAMTGKVDAANATTQPAITQSVQKSVGSFIDYIKRVENQGKAGYDAKRKLWFPHESFEGGSDTIGYGHKIQKGEDYSKGITDAHAEDLLKKDLDKAKQQVYKELGGVKLTPQQEEMFIDFVFNMGTLKKFPKFTQSALKNDLEGMKSQYKRYAGGKELKGRNAEFLKRFLSEYFGFNYYF